MSTSRKLANSLKRYLSPEETHSIIYENSSRNADSSNIDITYESMQTLRNTGRENLAQKKARVIYSVNEYIDTNILSNFFKTGLDKEILHNAPKGLYGYYIYFRSNVLKTGFERIIKDTTIKRKKRLTVLKDTFESDNMMGLKVQIFYTTDPYYEVKAMREETIMDYLANTEFREYIPQFHFGCTITVPVIFENETLQIKVRLTFIEHLGEYQRLLEYLIIAKNLYHVHDFMKPGIREEMVVLKTKLSSILEMLWKAKISHNDFHFGNIMIRTRKITNLNPGKNTIVNFSVMKDPIIKLIDYGNATRIDKNTDVTETAYQTYYKNRLKKETNNGIALIDGSEGEGSNVQNLHDIIQKINEAFEIT